MSRRHIKVIAIAVLVFVTLTGARRGGGGGGCDDDKDSQNVGSSSVSGGSGGLNDDFDANVPDTSSGGLTSGGTTGLTSGGTTGTTGSTGTTGTTGTTSGGSRPNYSRDASSDVRVTSCDYDQSTKKFVTRVRITNTSAHTMRYSISVRVERRDGPQAGSLLASTMVSENAVAPNEAREVVSESYRPLYERTSFTCKVSRASRYLER